MKYDECLVLVINQAIKQNEETCVAESDAERLIGDAGQNHVEINVIQRRNKTIQTRRINSIVLT